ncbi:leucine-rich repeat-containing protein 74A-like [Saccostrea echinata]|uniref:leucine-rich repeat-containing protein 74A-like n=1 Tax=Saccostrea echinata TaxID=191078 RepID=UPI002A7EDD60|nr:leucine-rich repeat-containing protein 74A-like [Saccostrea echinata]
MISENSAVQKSGKRAKAKKVSKEIEAEMNAIKEVTIANNLTAEVLEPEDYDTDLEEEKYPKCYTVPLEERPRVIYTKACHKFNLTPSSSCLRGMTTGIVNLNHQNLGPDGAKAVALGLVLCETVSELHMSGNNIGHSGTKYIIDMLRENENIAVVNLADNNLQSDGARLLCEMLNENDAILSVNVSGNNFKPTDAHSFYTMMSYYRCTLKELDISNNNFGEYGGKLIGEAIGNNDTIETLNISWNGFGFNGAKAIAKGLEENTCLKSLDISWNGLEDHGSELIATATSINDVMINLNLSANRIGPKGLGLVLKAISNNKSIKSLNVSRNPITFEGPVIAVQTILEHPECGLESIEFRDMCVPRQFLPILMKIHEGKPQFRVKHGGYVNASDVLHHSMEQRMEHVLNDPMMRLLQYVHDRKLRLADLFFQFDTDRNMTISDSEFVAGIRRAGIPMTDTQIQELVDKLDVDGDGEIDFGELKLGEKKYLQRIQKVGVELPFGSKTGKQSSRPASKTSNVRSRPASNTSRPVSSTSAQTMDRPMSNTSRPVSRRSVQIMDRPMSNSSKKTERPKTDPTTVSLSKEMSDLKTDLEDLTDSSSSGESEEEGDNT